MPLHMRLPKLKGFRNRFRTEYQVVNVGDLAGCSPRAATSVPRSWSRPAPSGRNSWSRCSATASWTGSR
jgi:large subunit ribosomal protein L15